jgi:hypothetical protein
MKKFARFFYISFLAILFFGLGGSAQASSTFSILPWLITSQTGCAQPVAPGQCGPVDYVPVGRIGVTPGYYSDSLLVEIIKVCHPSIEGMAWLTSDDPELSPECEDILLRGLPLDYHLVQPMTASERLARRNLALSLQALLFLPMADAGGYFGDASGEVYCPDIYQDYFFAKPVSDADTFKIQYSEGLEAVPGRKRVQFILERTKQFRYKEADEEDSVIASEYRGKITFRTNFAEIENAVLLAATLIHESRHNDEGFSDGARHIVCDFGDYQTDTESCDRTHFGAYGVGNAYLDSVIRAGIRTRTEDGLPLFTWSVLKDLYYRACSRYLDRIQERSEDLVAHLESFGCEPSNSNLLRSLSVLYGLASADVWIQGKLNTQPGGFSGKPLWDGVGSF